MNATEVTRAAMKVTSVAVACLLLAICGGCGGKEEAAPKGAKETATVAKVEPKAPAASLEWNTYHGTSTLEGVAAVRLPDTPVLRWRFSAQADVINTPVAGEGRIFFSDGKGRIYAVSLEGKEIWSKTFVGGKRQDGTPIMETFDAPLACFNGMLIAGSSNGVVYALDAATGDERWKSDIDGTILGTAAYRPDTTKADGSGGRLYVIDQSGGALHCLDFATGAKVWTSEPVARCDGSASVGQDFVAFGSCAAALHVMSAQDGSMLCEIPIDDDSQVAGGVAMVGDLLFSGSRSGKVIQANARTGAVVWTNHDAQDEAFATPAVNADWVVIGTADRNVYGLDRATGKKKWAFDTAGQPTSAAIAEDKVVVGAKGTLFLLRLADGTQVWSYDVGDTITSPAIVGELVVVGSDDGTVAAFGAGLAANEQGSVEKVQ